MCVLRTFMREHACDMCDAVILKGTSCRDCDFDLCHNCAVPARFTFERVTPTEPAFTIPIIVEPESIAAPLPPVLPEKPPSAVHALLPPSASAPNPVDPANAPTDFHASQLVAAVPAPLLDTDVIPRMSRLKLKKTAAVAALADPTARAEAATALAQTPQVPASTAIFRSLVSSIIVLLATVDAHTRDLLKDELMASILP